MITLYKQDNPVRENLEKIGCSKDEIEALMPVSSFSRFGHLSVKAWQMIIPYLKEGCNYDAACAKAGFDYRMHNGYPDYLLKYNKEDMASITSPRCAARGIADYKSSQRLHTLHRLQPCIHKR